MNKLDMINRVKIVLKAMALLLVIPLLLFTNGCATPSGGLSHTIVLQPDQEDNIGGSFIESSDIRTIAAQMTTALLSIPEIAQKGSAVRIAIAPIRNSSRYIIDKDIFSKKLRLELNQVSEGKVKFFSQGVGQDVREEILTERQENLWDSLIDQAASALLAAPVVTESTQVLRVAVIPVKNTNLTGVNAESFTSLLRAKVSDNSKGKFVFLSREANGKVTEQILDEQDLKDQGLVTRGGAKQLFGVDYFLTGEFIAQSIMNEGAADVVETKIGRSPDDPGAIQGKVTQSQKNPNVTKYLNVKFVDAETAAVPFEKLIKVESKITSGVERADFILTGELSALSKAAQGGDRSDYIIMSFQLVDPVSNEIVWEKAYETKKKTNVGVIYK
jgi:PBP1b-binding outer membrane lipoprotein LpoB